MLIESTAIERYELNMVDNSVNGIFYKPMKGGAWDKSSFWPKVEQGKEVMEHILIIHEKIFQAFSLNHKLTFNSYLIQKLLYTSLLTRDFVA